MKMKILVLVKTYPAISKKYGEIVCTAGITEDGKWIRIYPIPFRKINYHKRFKKYDWIEIELTKNKKDFRPESYRPIDYQNFRIVGNLPSDKGTWEERRKFVLKNIYTDMSALIDDARDKQKSTSLAIFKPHSILGFSFMPTEREWSAEKLQSLENSYAQGRLFKTEDEEDIEPFEVVDKLPYKFKFEFTDEKQKKFSLMIEDWEIGMLYWNCLKKHKGDEEKACEDVKKKYFEDFAKTKDYYFILGTTLKHHKTAKNPFIIIGDFRPKPIEQPELFSSL